MAVTYDNSSAIGQTNSGTTITLALTIGGTANFLVAVLSNDIAQASAPSCTWNGVSMNVFAFTKQPVSGTQIWQTIFYLANPATGTHNLIATYAGGGTSDASIVGMSFNGAASVGNSSVAQGVGSGTHTATAAINTGDMMVGLFSNGDTGTNTTVGGSNGTKSTTGSATSAMNTNTGSGSITTTISDPNTTEWIAYGIQIVGSTAGSASFLLRMI